MRITHHLVIKRAGARRAPGGDVPRGHRTCVLPLTRFRIFRIVFRFSLLCAQTRKDRAQCRLSKSFIKLPLQAMLFAYNGPSEQI